jgi:transposase
MTMAIVETRPVTGVTAGVDTHLDAHVAAALDQLGGQLGVESFPANPAGYQAILDWLGSFGPVKLVGIEGTGSYGAGLARHLRRARVAVVEVDRPNRQDRHRHGKSDTIDAVAAAHAALSGRAQGAGKHSNGPIEAIRVLTVVKRSCREERIRTRNQIRQLAFCAPDELREATKNISRHRLAAEAARWRPRAGGDVVLYATRVAMSTLGRRVLALEAEATRIDELLVPLVTQAAPSLLELLGVGPDTAAILLVAAGDNPGRIRSEAAWAHLCGVAPIPASTGKTTRRRLNRGGNRQANHALYRIVITRMRYDPRTRSYVEQHLAAGSPKPEIIRSLKRYVAREVYRHLPRR